MGFGHGLLPFVWMAVGTESPGLASWPAGQWHQLLQAQHSALEAASQGLPGSGNHGPEMKLSSSSPSSEVPFSAIMSKKQWRDYAP